MIHLTENAVKAVQAAIAGATEPVEGLRIMVEAGGCAGFKYMVALVDQSAADDHVVETDGIKVYIDPASYPHLKGTIMDFVVSLQGSGFSFNNPNASSSCSCGKSFN